MLSDDLFEKIKKVKALHDKFISGQKPSEEEMKLVDELAPLDVSQILIEEVGQLREKLRAAEMIIEDLQNITF